MIIGLTGYAQSGKDTVAQFLVQHYGFERRAFADKIRNMVYELNVYGVRDVVDSIGWEKAKQMPTVRELLQNLGVSARTNISKDVWVNAALSDIDITKNYVISDVRFDNEVNAIRDMSGEIWRITRPGVGPVNSHVSESELNSFLYDRLIDNDGTTSDLEKKLTDILNDIYWNPTTLPA